MTTGYEVSFYRHIEQIERHLNRIANCLEAAEERARKEEDGRDRTTDTPE